MTFFFSFKSKDHSKVSYPEHSLQIHSHPIEPNTNTHDLVTTHNAAFLFGGGSGRVAKTSAERGDCSWLLTPALTLASGFFFSPNSPWASVGVTVTKNLFFYSRPATSFAWFSSPFKSLRYILWRRFKWKIIAFLVIVLLVALVALFFYAAPVSCLVLG